MSRQIRLLQLLDWDSPHQNASLRQELTAGLLQPKARIAPKFFYDSLGSRLFEAITELPEYYPTRTEGADLHESHRVHPCQLPARRARYAALARRPRRSIAGRSTRASGGSR